MMDLAATMDGVIMDYTMAEAAASVDARRIPLWRVFLDFVVITLTLLL